MSKSLCVIPARSGSKGLKDKNILELCGLPVLAYTINVCKESSIFEEIFVATDDEKYAKIAEKYGAEVPFLEPVELAKDEIPSLDPVLFFKEKLDYKCDYIWCMQPTSPLRNANDIIRAYDILEKNNNCNFVLSTTEIDPHYFHWALIDDEKEMSKLYFGDRMLVDRSELKEIVHRPNGAIKVGRTESVIKSRSFFGRGIKRVDMPVESSIHIRNKMDFDMCEYILKMRRNGI